MGREGVVARRDRTAEGAEPAGRLACDESGGEEGSELEGVVLSREAVREGDVGGTDGWG